MTNQALVTFGRSLEGFAESGAAKFATLWFDELQFELGSILNTGSVHLPGGAPDFEEWKRRVLTAQEPEIDEDVFQIVRGCWKAAGGAQNEPSVLDNALSSSLEAAIEIAATEYRESLELEGLDGLDLAKESGAATDNLRRHLKAWLPVSRDTALVGDSLERTTLKTLSSFVRLPAQHETFCDVKSSRVPDFADLSWEEIVELRDHQNYSHFRSKILEFNEMITQGEVGKAGEMLEHLVNEALFDIARLARPHVSRSVVKGLIGNLPLGPIPLNPFGLYFAAKDAAKEREIERLHGWMYFLFDLQEMATRR
jgi:hypothetical protein